MQIPEQFKKNVTSVLKDAAPVWLDYLPTVIQSVANFWQLEHIVPMANLSYNYVCKAHSNHYRKSVIIKICLTAELFDQEYTALHYFAGQGSVACLDAHSEYNALLLEFIEPGKSLKSLWPAHDEQAVMITVQVIAALHTKTIADKYHKKTVADWMRIFTDMHDTFFKEHSVRAQKWAHELLATQSDCYFLHGDLHHENILQGPQNIWKSIDPHGIVGDLAYEVGAFIRNPFPEIIQYQDSKTIIEQRIRLFSAQLSLDVERVLKWSYVQSVLAACWALQDNQQDACKKWIQVAELLYSVQ